jgi:hypothetical protein
MARVSDAVAMGGGITQASAACTSGLTLTTSGVDVPGCSITLPVAGSNAFYTAWYTFDIQYTAAGVSTGVGWLYLDGTQIGNAAILDGGGTLAPRGTVGNQWSAPVAAGSHTWKLQALKTAAPATIVANSQHSVLTVLLVDR